MGLFNKNSAGSRNIMESIRRENDTRTLIKLDPCQDFNTYSTITVEPNEQAIFIKNGQIFGILPSGTHQVKTENYPVLSQIRNVLTGGNSTFTCKVYHVNFSEQNVRWGTPSAIEIQDFFLGNGKIGVPTLIRGAGEFRVRFNLREDENASIQTFMRLMGDQTTFTVDDLSRLFHAQISQEINEAVGRTIEELSYRQSINSISRYTKSVAQTVAPIFEELFREYGLELINFSFYNLSIEKTEVREKYIDRGIAAANVTDSSYNQAVQQELLKDIANNPGAGGIASAGAGLGMGIAAGNAFANIATTAFAQPQQPVQPQNNMGFNAGNRFGAAGNNMAQQAPAAAPQQDPFEVLSKLKKMLDAGLISQQQYEAKVNEIMSRL